MPAFTPDINGFHPWRNTGYNYQQMLAFIPPRDFLHLAQNPFGSHVVSPENIVMHPKYVKIFTNAMIKGTPIDGLYLGLEEAVILDETTNYYKIIRANPKVHVDNYEHEGRNRASIAIKLSIPFIPVRFDIPPLKNWFSGYEVFDKIWEKPKVEGDILRYLGITRFKLDAVG